jgi:hypothetical protein
MSKSPRGSASIVTTEIASISATTRLLSVGPSHTISWITTRFPIDDALASSSAVL